MNAVDWSRIHSGEFIYEKGCWTTCGGGYCCAGTHPDFHFQLLPRRGTTLLYMEPEYEHLRAQDMVLPAAAQTIELDFGGPKPLRLVHMTCELLGRCEHIKKPLLCRLYPFIPVFSVEGAVESLMPASIFDLTMELRGWTSPCTVSRAQERYRTLWGAEGAILEPLRHPYLFFYLRAASFFRESYERRLAQNAKLNGKLGKDFWQTWEVEYLSGELFDLSELKGKLLEWHQMLYNRYGDFL